MNHADERSPDVLHDWRLDQGMALCFLAGAGSIFFGDLLLTTPNPSFDTDMAMLGDLGLERQRLPFRPRSRSLRGPRRAERERDGLAVESRP